MNFSRMTGTKKLRPVVSMAIASACLLAGIVKAGGAVAETAGTSTGRLVHRYLQVVIAPKGDFVASVEGDSPPGGYYPELRDLIIRRTADGAQTHVALSCGRVPQCWPSSPAWSPDGRHLSFALRTPGSHAYAVYDVAPDGTHLTRLFFTASLR
jgi:hypothetical protein